MKLLLKALVYWVVFSSLMYFSLAFLCQNIYIEQWRYELKVTFGVPVICFMIALFVVLTAKLFEE